jgi:hypothetical protein
LTKATGTLYSFDSLLKLQGKIMTEETKEKDFFVLYLGLATAVLIGVLLAVKSSESDKYAPIKDQLDEENKLMNIRVINELYE